jgi:DNA-binding MarR family transcriptional regulator
MNEIKHYHSRPGACPFRHAGYTSGRVGFLQEQAGLIPDKTQRTKKKTGTHAFGIWHYETLNLLAKDPTKSWSMPEIRHTFGLSPRWTQKVIERLIACGLVKRSKSTVKRQCRPIYLHRLTPRGIEMAGQPIEIIRKQLMEH